LTDPILTALRSHLAGRYTVERELGRGGMGAVFLARDLSLDREVAIKVMPQELAVQPALRERFVREAKLAASLSHPNIVHVHAVEEQGDFLAIVMQFVDGETLSERVARSGPYDATDTAQLLQDTAWALGYAHARGIVHRDVKPDNLLIERGTGRALILDFGIARQEKASTLTEVGQSIGTPAFMSPEQAAAESVDGRSDIYSLGCVGFFAATGRPPFDGTTAHKLLMQHLTTPAPTVVSVRPEFSTGLSAIIDKTLAKEPSGRFESGEQLAEAIGALQLRSREVAPLLRLFHQQTAQLLQAVLVLVAVLIAFTQIAPADDQGLTYLVAVFFATLGVTSIGQLLERIRFVVRQGFGIADVRSAVDTIESETERAKAQLLGDPIEARRIQRRKRFSFVAGFLCGTLFPISLRYLSTTERSARQISTPGALLLTLAVVMLAMSIAYWAMRPVKITLPQRLAGRFWHSRFGDWLFARAQRRYARELAGVKS
jgi:serine/threonine-protein kinase